MKRVETGTFGHRGTENAVVGSLHQVHGKALYSRGLVV
jgi:hypothetical protein